MLFQSVLVLAASYLISARIIDVNTNGPVAKRDVESGTPTPAPAGFEQFVSQIFPPVNATGQEWSAAYDRAVEFVMQLTIAELSNVTTGYGILGRCVGGTGSVPRLNFPGICLQDAPSGIRFANGNSVFGVGLNAAMTFDSDLMRAQGVAMGEEFTGKGINVALGPAMNLARAPAAGRNWEGAGGDPFLVGVHAAATIKGLQSTGIMACAKHFIANEQEHFRGGSQNPASSSNIEDRTMNELYLWPFAESVRAGVASVMCAYQEVNNTFSCENSASINGLLKGQLNFQGFVVSDWAAATSGPSTILGGTDMNMPGFRAYGNVDQPNPAIATNGFYGANIAIYLNESRIPMSRLQDMAIRIMTPYYHLGQDLSSYPTLNFNSLLHPITQNIVLDDPSEENINVQSDHAILIREVGAASTVLLKNSKSILPLQLRGPRSLKNVGIFGSDSANAAAGPNGGTSNFPYLIAPLDAITSHLNGSDARIQSITNDFDYPEITRIAAESDVCLVFVNSDSGEGYITVEGNAGDRNNLSLWHAGDMLIRTVAAECDETVVIIHAPGAVDVEQWIDIVQGVLFAGLPGQESGNSIVDFLFGAVNPSARLPFTIAKAREDYPADVIYTAPEGMLAPQITYNEKLLIDYRWFDKKDIVPRFEFGFGLSYTEFSHSGARLSIIDQSSNPPSILAPGGMTHLFERALSVSFDVRNIGKEDGNEVSQLYLGFPSAAGEPPKVLRGFNRSFIRKQDTASIEIELNNKAISVWDVINQEWSVPEGEFIVYIGSSSRDVKLLAGFTNINGILSVSTVDQAPPKGRGNGRGPPEGPRGKGPREPQGPRREKGPNGRNEPKM